MMLAVPLKADGDGAAKVPLAVGAGEPVEAAVGLATVVTAWTCPSVICLTGVTVTLGAVVTA